MAVVSEGVGNQRCSGSRTEQSPAPPVRVGMLLTMSNLCCFIQDSDTIAESGGTPCWPPPQPPVCSTHDGFCLIRGYLKRKSAKGDSEPKWALRWMEIDPPTDERTDYMVRTLSTP